MRFFLATLLLLSSLLLSTRAISAEPITLTVEEWTAAGGAGSRVGETLVARPALASVVDAFERQPDNTVIVIAHSSGEAGELWAEELRSWFVALGIPSSRIRFDSRPELQGALILDVRERASL